MFVEIKCKICGNIFTGKPFFVVCGSACREIYRRTKRKEQRKRHSKKHRQKINAKKREKYNLRQEVRDKSLEYHRQWRVNNREKIKKYKREHNEGDRHRHKRLGLVFDLKPTEWNETYEHFNHACAYCGAENDNMHRDHFIPISRGGGYTRGNIVPACPRCNINKSNKHPLEWLIIKEHGLIVFVKVAQYLGYM